MVLLGGGGLLGGRLLPGRRETVSSRRERAREREGERGRERERETERRRGERESTCWSILVLAGHGDAAGVTVAAKGAGSARSREATAGLDLEDKRHRCSVLSAHRSVSKSRLHSGLRWISFAFLQAC